MREKRQVRLGHRWISSEDVESTLETAAIAPGARRRLILEARRSRQAEQKLNAGVLSPESFVNRFIFSTDHKIVGIQYMLFGFVMMLISGLLAGLMRWQLAFPGSPIPVLGSLFPSGMPGGIMVPEFYNALFTMHATIMIFFGIVPVLIGGFGNYLIPLQIGARDFAFPRLNMLSFWLTLSAGILMLASFGVAGGAASGGWTAYPPLSAIALGNGQTLWILSIALAGAASTLGAVNFLTTIVNMRASGMTFGRLPLTIWSFMVTSVLLLLSIPVLTAAGLLLLSDRELGSGFFVPAGLEVSGEAVVVPAGGQPLLWQHLFWFFGHPEVYIMILPAMGMISDILPVFARKPIFGYRAMTISMMLIAFLGFLVWGHHMFQSGMNPALGTSFMLATMLIAVPSSIKTFNWLGTLWGGQIEFSVPMMNALAFISMFVIGGLSGIFMASTPVDVFLHDTYFIVGHIHYVLFGGTMFAIFAATSFWYPKMFGRMMSRRLGVIHFWVTIIGFNGVFFPMHILGVRGMPRRLFDFRQYENFADLHGLNVLMTMSAFLLIGGQFIFMINFFRSMRAGERAPANPWRANTLEWSVDRPGHGNFAELPVVWRPPYEYSVPGADEDYLPQDRPAAPATEAVQAGEKS